jgi:ankyrin repeat protein
VTFQFKIGAAEYSLLHAAAVDGHYSCAEFLLLDMGINAIVKNNIGHTPLHYCAVEPFTDERAKTIKLLLANGASLEKKSDLGNTPL